MPRADLFLDSSALVAGAISKTGAARALLLLAEAQFIHVTVSEQVLAETERAIARKIPAALSYYRELLRGISMRIVPIPTPYEVHAYQDITTDPTDVPIIVAAMNAKVDYLVTLNRRHFIDDPLVATRSGLRIGTPGDALAWIRSQRI